MTAMLFSAFCLEAYFNHLGNSRVNYWNIIERKLSPEEKFEVLTKVLGFSPEIGKRPFQTLKEIIRFRNKIAHAKTEYLCSETTGVEIISETPEFPLTQWEEKISLQTAQNFVEDTGAIIKELHKMAKFTTDPFWTSWNAKWEKEILE